MVTSEWYGDHPFYLVLSFPDENKIIDLDEGQWSTTYADYLRRPGNWILVHKASGAEVLGIIVRDGDQPYYTARHIGVMGSAGSNEITAYGIGKKRPDGFVERLWLLPTGMVVTGDDVEEIGVRLIHLLGPRPT
jgi:hypothetical protein